MQASRFLRLFAIIGLVVCRNRILKTAEKDGAFPNTPSWLVDSPGAKHSSYKGWVSSFISVTIISAVSVALIVPVVLCRKLKIYRYIIETLVALAAGALLSDSLMHIYPEMVRKDFEADHHQDNETIHHDDEHLHTDHDDHSHSEHDHAGHSHKPFYPSIAVITTIFGFYLLEFGIHHFSSDDRHSGEKPLKNEDGVGIVNMNSTSCTLDNHFELHRSHAGIPMETVVHITENHEGNTQTGDAVKVSMKRSDRILLSLKNIIRMFRSRKIVLMLTFGDIMHNCIDGIAISSQFMKPWPVGYKAGIMTSIAILLHEIPHELGDNAAMIASGFSVKGTIIMNFAACIGAYIGVILGCALGNISAGSVWVDAIVAGMLLYISLGVLFPNMFKSVEKSERPVLIIFCHFIGITIGVLAVTSVGLIEYHFGIGH